MSRPRLPVVAGLGAGAGTSTLAAALHAIDGGRWAGGPVDVLVCRAEDDLTALPPVPVLVVRAGGPVPRTRPGAVVVLPEVAAWRDEDATRTAARLLGLGPGRRPPDLRGYAEALVAVVGALLRSGVLDPAHAPRILPPPPAAAPGDGPVRGIPRPEPPRPAPAQHEAGRPRPDEARPARRRRVVVGAPALPTARPPGPANAGAPPEPAVGPAGDGRGGPRLVRPAAVPPAPVLLHRAEPVRPRLVAGRALRIAPGTPERPPATHRRLRIAPAATPAIAPGVPGDGADDDTIDGDTIDRDGHPVRGAALRTG